MELLQTFPLCRLAGRRVGMTLVGGAVARTTRPAQLQYRSGAVWLLTMAAFEALSLVQDPDLPGDVDL